MKRSSFLHGVLAACGMALVPAYTAHAQGKPKEKKRKPDLADAAEGRYVGDVTSDSEGAPRNDVTLTVTRIGKDTVRVSSNYDRLPVVDVPLERAMDKILNAKGPTTFLLDRSKSGTRLDVSFMNEVSWAGTKR